VSKSKQNLIQPNQSQKKKKLQQIFFSSANIHQSQKVAKTKQRKRSFCIAMDDIMIDYTSMLGLEDKRARFSEDVVDMDLKK
jgi:hypothetical protein